ncbi:MAG: type II toxin-antitoxin system HicB family antitoxin [Actinobacteria bacterium]|nr:type II toxin-antitoxin system HicB family antitoxin [Actinomycetota bacterium]
MQLSHAISGLENAVEAQLRVAGSETADIGSQLLNALRPAIRQTLMEVVTMAATEVSSQLRGSRVEVRLVDGDPELIVAEDASAVPPPPPPPGTDDDEARITLRLPGYLKELIAEAAAGSGDSLNAFVVDALRSKTHSSGKSGSRYRTTIEL